MKIIILCLSFVLVFGGYIRNNNSKNIIINESFHENSNITNEKIEEKTEEIVEIIQQERQQYNELGEVVSFTFERIIDYNVNIKIHKNGILELNNVEYIWNNNVHSNVYDNNHFEDDFLLHIHRKNNLLGLDILLQYFSGGTASYTLLINIETKEEILNQRSHVDEYDNWVSLWDMFPVGDILVLYFFGGSGTAFAYDSISGGVLWTQTYNRQKGLNRTIIYEDHFIVNDINSNRYRIFIDGRKEIVIR